MAPLLRRRRPDPRGRPRGEEGRAARESETVQSKPEDIRAEDRRGPAQEVVRRGLPLRPAVPRRGSDRPRAHHRGDRDDRREHPRPPLHPLRARGGAVSDADDRDRPSRRDGRPLPADPAQAVRRGAPRRPDLRRRPGVLRVHRPPGRRGPPARRPGRDRRRRRQHLPRPRGGGQAGWTGRPATTSGCSPRS